MVSVRHGWLAIVFLAMLVSACSPGTTDPTSTSAAARTEVTTQLAGLDIPPEALVAEGVGQPATATYWAEWNSCSGNDKAAIAAANGGAVAGWFLVDDFLGPPGVWVGDLVITNCQQVLDILQARSTTGQAMSSDPAYPLASQLLAAQFNMAAGAEFCPAAEEAILAGHILLSHLGFDGKGDYLGDKGSVEDRQSAQRVFQLLDLYNRGMLCQ